MANRSAGKPDDRKGVGERGHLDARGKPFNPNSVAVMPTVELSSQAPSAAILPMPRASNAPAPRRRSRINRFAGIGWRVFGKEASVPSCGQ
jgi:hypothetical protein